MSRRIMLVAVVTSLASISTSLAQSTQPQNTQPSSDRLKKLLEEKFIPPPSERPTTFDKKDYHPIVPPKQNSPQPGASGQPGRGGQLAPHDDFSIALSLSAINTKLRSALFRLADNRIDSGLLIMANSSEFRQPNERVHPTPDRESFVVAQQGPPDSSSGAIANVYLIQLKPNATEQQIMSLLRKYGLTPIGGVANLYILRVRGKEVAIGSAPGQSQNPFTQKILTDLRREPIVAAAAVDTTLTVRSVPRSVNTSFDSGDVSHTWTWKNDRASTAGLLSSSPAKSVDGNWGLKAIRMPPVWTVIQRYRAANPNLARPKVAIIDTGFSNHEDLSYETIYTPSGPTAPPAATATIFIPCNPSGHGNHVAGIVGATYGNGVGIDGIVPQAKMDAVVALTVESLIQDPALAGTTFNKRIEMFGNILPGLYNYLYSSSAKAEGGRLVVNVSLGYNISDPTSIPGHDKNIAAHAIMFGGLMRDFEKTVLFVAAAGNDSEGRITPLDAKWSSPITWAATEARTAGGPLKNIIVVEAHNRFGERATFSNLSKRGSVSAPGVDILSTLVPGKQDYHICQGTSQAAPHVSGVAALLFELDPNKTPAEIAEVIRSSAIKPPRAPGEQIVQLAPRLDALNAVLRLSQYTDSRNRNLVRLADLNGDGKVDAIDMKEFSRRLAIINDNRANGTPFTEDMNGDGVVDGNECNWPLIDLNGSGAASLSLADAKIVLGLYRTDLDIMALAWTDKSKDFKTALIETGLDVALQSAEMAPMAITSKGCR